MNRFEGRVKKLSDATHTFIRARDWKGLLAYWKAPLDNANVKPEDFKTKCDDISKVLNKIGIDDPERFRAELHRFAAADRLAYYALMYHDMLDLSRAHPRGYWIKNSQEVLVKILRDSRQRTNRLKC